jgi:hypothetical protein
MSGFLEIANIAADDEDIDFIHFEGHVKGKQTPVEDNSA